MIRALVYAVLGTGALGAVSICDPCQPTAGASTLPVAVHAPVAAVVTPQGVPAARVAALRTDTLHVNGMTCGGCVIGVRKVLSRLNGVTNADVSYEKTRAVVTYDPAKVTIKQIIAAIKTLGYTANIVTG